MEGVLTAVARSSLLSHDDDGSGMTSASVLLWRPLREGRWPGGRVPDRKCCITEGQTGSCKKVMSNVNHSHIYI